MTVDSLTTNPEHWTALESSEKKSWSFRHIYIVHC